VNFRAFRECFQGRISFRAPPEPRQGRLARVLKMSLLLEALKKAELAKARSPRGGGGGPLRAKPEPTKPVMTRKRLPDITQPLEILSDDLPPRKRRPRACSGKARIFRCRTGKTFEPPRSRSYRRTNSLYC